MSATAASAPVSRGRRRRVVTETATVTGLADLLRSWLGRPRASRRATASSRARRASRSPGRTATAARSRAAIPFTRGRTEIGYRDELWVMGQYSGYGTPQETNARFRRLLEAGQSGLSVALDLPTQMGLDSDHPQADGEVGKVGTPLDTVDDLIALLDGLPLENVRQIRTTANAIGPIFAAFVFVALEELGVDPGSVRVMLQNDPLKEYFARGTYIFPPAAGLRLAVDVVEHFANEIPRWEPIEFCGYHVRDSGGTAVDEVGIATADGIAYLDEARPPRARRGAARALGSSSSSRPASTCSRRRRSCARRGGCGRGSCTSATACPRARPRSTSSSTRSAARSRRRSR